MPRNPAWITWECPSCNLQQKVTKATKEVAHHCPLRDTQPAAAKGKRKLPLMVNFRVISQAPDLPIAAATSAQISSTARNGVKRATRANATSKAPEVK